MKALKLCVIVAAICALAVVAAPDAAANCGSNKVFSSAKSAGSPNMRLTPGEVGQGVANAIGRWWGSDNASLTSNFGTNAGTCDSVNWWFQLASGNKYIDGVLDNPALNCLGYSGCPGSAGMTVAVEDYGAAGPAEIGGTAYYAAWRVEDTPATLRRYNFGRTCNCSSGNNLRPFSEFPEVVITNSGRVEPNINITYDLAAQDANALTADGAANTALPVNSVITEWQLVVSTGLSDPGRARANWTILDRITYEDGGKDGNTFSVACTDINQDEWLAIGIGFNGGSSGVIDSALVGRAIQLECDPTIAQPDGDRPTATKPGGLSQPDVKVRGRR